MNAKKIKALRKMLKNWGNLTEESAKMPEHQFLEDTNKATTVIVTKEELEAAGVNPQDYEVANRGMVTSAAIISDKEKGDISSVYKVKIKTGPIRNDGQSKRGLYLHFKEELIKLDNNRNRKRA